MFEKIRKLKRTVIDLVFWAEKNLDGKTGAKKKAAVVKKLDEMIELPAYLEWIDDIFIGKLVDMACEKLNEFAGHNFKEIEISEKQKKDLADEIEINLPEGKDHE